MRFREAKLSLVVAVSAFASGAALVAYVVTGLSLGLGLLLTCAAGGVTVAMAWRRLSPTVRDVLKRRVWLGLGIGLAATLAYDGVRVLVVTGFGLHVTPFAAIPLFGQAILGADAPADLRFEAGLLYHYLNGVAFSVGYVVLFRNRPWPLGVLWALVLEAAMLSIYPGWLHIDALLEEFTLMSASGHLAFGTTLGVLAQSLPARLERPRPRRLDQEDRDEASN